MRGCREGFKQRKDREISSSDAIILCHTPAGTLLRKRMEGTILIARDEGMRGFRAQNIHRELDAFNKETAWMTLANCGVETSLGKG